MNLLRSSWQRCRRLLPGFAGDRLYDELVAAYAEPPRKYHTLQHLTECIAGFEATRGLAERPDEVELALWFHDAVYDVQARDNEARSAAWLLRAALECGAGPALAARLHALVMVTRHVAVPASADEQLLVDIDLSILGAGVERFDGYERQVREEYAWVPAEDYRRGRRAVLAGFSSRPRIYGTAGIHDRLEVQARANLDRSLRRLDGFE
jgi:predicted metal-dependent HD superfamily phosphohydrolase